MKLSLLKQAALIGAAALALASSPAAAQSPWSSFKAAELSGFSFTHAHLPDGRYLFGTSGQVRLQSVPGSTQLDPVSNQANRLFDPAFIAVRNASSALIGGGGGFSTNNGLFPFDPSQPALAIAASLTSAPHPNAYAAVWWAHPVSGREGWLLSGTNAAGQNNLSFLSADGASFGPLSSALSSFSGALTVAPNGDVLLALADLDSSFLPTEFDNLILRFSADQIDASVAALLNSTPLLLTRAAASTVFQAAASGSLAVDAQNRVWVAGYQIPYLQLWDAAGGILRRVLPLPAPPANHAGPTTYSVKTFSQSATPRVSFLANDSAYSPDSDLVLGDAPVAAFQSRSVQFTQSSLSLSEFSSTPVPLTISITPPATTLISLQVAFSGSATAGQDYLSTPQTVIIAPGESSATLFNVTALDNASTDAGRTIIATLIHPENDTHFGLGAPGSETLSIQLIDNDIPPPIKRVQSFPALLQVGAAFSHRVTLDNPDVPVTRWRASGLPPGLSIDPFTGIISGSPTLAGDFDRILVSATNTFGTTTASFALFVAPLPAPVVGVFTGFFDRFGSTTGGLGARLDLVTTPSGAFTATVTVGKSRQITRGRLDSSTPNPTAFVSVNGDAILIVIDRNIGDLSGNSVFGSLSSALSGFKNDPGPARTGLCNFAATPAIALPGQPSGATHGAITLPAKGKARIAGRAADGTPFTSSSSLGSLGRIVLYHSLYRDPGTLCGILAIDASPAQLLSGSLTWSKPAQTSGTLYRAGWPAPLTLAITGGRFRPASGPILPLDTPPATGPNALITLTGGGLELLPPHPRTLPVHVISPTRITSTLPVRLAIQPRTGLISGSLTLADGRKALFSALAIPSGIPSAPFAATGLGHFTLPTPVKGTSLSGHFLLRP